MRLSRIVTLIIAFIICLGGIILVFSISENAGTEKAAGGIIISEVMTSNKGAVPDDKGNYPDWVEIHNTTDKEMDLGGYGLSDDKLVLAKWAIPLNTMVKPGGYIIIYCSGNASNGSLHAPFKLSASDDLILTNPQGSVVDSMKLSTAGGNTSLMRNEDGAFVETTDLSPGYPNTPEGATAYRESLKQNMIDNGVRINEFMASNKTTLPGPFGDYPDWIELYNTTDNEVDISNCFVSDSVNSPSKYKIPEGTIIQPGDVLIIYASQREGLVEGALFAPFSLSAYKEEVVFTGANGVIIDSVSYTNQEADISMARVPDGFGDFSPSSRPTPGYLNTEDGFSKFMENSPLPVGTLMLSEALINNVNALSVNNESPDWVELYNGGNEAVNLLGYALTDTGKNPAKWVFPDYTIEPGEYKTILCTGNNIKDTQKKNLETSFRLSSSGEMIFLYSPDGELLDKLQLKNAGADISYGRTNAELMFYNKPTPGAPNEGGYKGVTQRPSFSVTPGIFDSALEIEIIAQPGEQVYYTLDSTTPGEGAMLYTAPIHIEKNTVIRAIALKEGYLNGAVETGTYLFTGDGVNHSLPVATLVLNPDDLWDGKRGIYTAGDAFDDELPLGEALLTANYYQGRGDQGEEAQDEWERPAFFSIFDENTKTQVFSQDVATRIAGAFGRSRAQKGFNVIARAQYGSNRLAYPFFDNRPFTEYKSLVLRSGAQDQNRAKIRDELATGLLEGSDVHFLYQAYKPYVLYLNAEYWGVYFLKDKRSRFFVAAYEGVEDNYNLDLLKASTKVSHGSNKEWLALMDYIKTHDLGNSENYKYIEERIDVNSFMDYMICELYTGNSDYANIQYYKLPGGKWKWIYYDFCWGFSNVNHPTITNRRGDIPAASGLFNAMLKNASWRDAFVRRFAQLMETVFSQERIIALTDELYEIVEPEIKREREKFNQATFRGEKQFAESLGTYDGFIKEIEKIKEFAQKRPDVIKQQLKSELGLSDAYMAEVFG